MDLRERLLNTPISELCDAIESGEIPPDAVWDEVIASMDRSLEHLGEISETNRKLLSFLDSALPDLARRQDQIELMLAEWRALGESHRQMGEPEAARGA